MSLNSKQVTINDNHYEVRELTIGELMPLLPRLNGEDSEAQLELMKLTVLQEGKPMGDDVKNLGVSAYMGLIEHVLDVNGLGGKES